MTKSFNNEGEGGVDFECSLLNPPGVFHYQNAMKRLSMKKDYVDREMLKSLLSRE